MSAGIDASSVFVPSSASDSFEHFVRTCDNDPPFLLFVVRSLRDLGLHRLRDHIQGRGPETYAKITAITGADWMEDIGA